MNSDAFYSLPSNQSKQQQQPLLCQQTSSLPLQQSVDRCLATGHRTNPHSYYAATKSASGSATRGRTELPAAASRACTGSGGCDSDEAGPSGGGAPCQNSNYYGSYASGLNAPDRGDTSGIDNVHRAQQVVTPAAALSQQQHQFGFSQYIPQQQQLGQQQQQQHRQQQLEQRLQHEQQQEQHRQQQERQRWLLPNRNPEQFNQDGNWMANVTDNNALPAAARLVDPLG